MKTSHIYPGAHSLSSYLTIKGCSNAIDFYKKAFGAIEKGRLLMPDGTIGHAEIEIEGSLLMMADENLEWGNKSPLTIGGNPVTLGLYVQEVDIIFLKAVEAGGKPSMPVSDQFYGDRMGQIMDPFGYKWMIMTHLEDVPFSEMQKRSDKLFSSEKK